MVLIKKGLLLKHIISLFYYISIKFKSIRKRRQLSLYSIAFVGLSSFLVEAEDGIVIAFLNVLLISEKRDIGIAILISHQSFIYSYL